MRFTLDCSPAGREPASLLRLRSATPFGMAQDRLSTNGRLLGLSVRRSAPEVEGRHSIVVCSSRGLRLLACHCVLLWGLFSTGCQWLDGSAQTGHQDIAASIRRVLDAAYAGADHARYSANLRALEAVAAARSAAVPPHLKPRIEQMLSNLRTAREVLGWQAEHSAPRPAEVQAWIARHPFLQAAVGATADAPDTFDIHTALHLLWDQTNEILRDVQVKNRPI